VYSELSVIRIHETNGTDSHCAVHPREQPAAVCVNVLLVVGICIVLCQYISVLSVVCSRSKDLIYYTDADDA